MIVLSILLALGVVAWWQNRLSRDSVSPHQQVPSRRACHSRQEAGPLFR
jgi:hypothetical protein